MAQYHFSISHRLKHSKMGRDNHPRTRQTNKLARKSAQKVPYDRILIVTEGRKTEPNYFNEIRSSLRLSSTNIYVQYSQIGTCPLQVVKFAESLLISGDIHKQLAPLKFDRIYAVFDRDNHLNYQAALSYAASINNKHFNDEKRKVIFKAIPSVPNFELWLLIHYVDVLSPLTRHETLALLRKHIGNYNKGQNNIYAITNHLLPTAQSRANDLDKNGANGGVEPYTDVGKLVELLKALRI